MVVKKIKSRARSVSDFNNFFFLFLQLTDKQCIITQQFAHLNSVDIVQLSVIALKIYSQIFDCNINAGIYTHLLRLFCAKTTLNRLTLLVVERQRRQKL